MDRGAWWAIVHRVTECGMIESMHTGAHTHTHQEMESSGAGGTGTLVFP